MEGCGPQSADPRVTGVTLSSELYFKRKGVFFFFLMQLLYSLSSLVSRLVFQMHVPTLSLEDKFVLLPHNCAHAPEPRFLYSSSLTQRPTGDQAVLFQGLVQTRSVHYPFFPS